MVARKSAGSGSTVAFSGTDWTSNQKRSFSNDGGSGTGNIKQFMSRALFGPPSSRTSSNKKLLEEEMAREVKDISDSSLIWESAATPTGPEVIHTHSSRETATELLLSFTEDPKARTAVTKLLSKAQKAEHVHFRYEYAVKCYLKALNILKKAKYPDDHPTVTKTVALLNNAYHVLSSYNNSANIVKMGIKNEDAGELVKALKMYTIAYRIRRDNLSPNHPSLVVLLNMLGSIQIKRGELKEAMQIYELALNDSPVMFSAASEDENEHHVENLLARSVTYREMGTIHEMWGNVDEALNFYHKSLECVAEWRETVTQNNVSIESGNGLVGVLDKNNESVPRTLSGDDGSSKDSSSSQSTSRRPRYSIENVQFMSSVGDKADASCSGLEHGEMELVFGTEGPAACVKAASTNVYERFFPANEDVANENDKPSDENSHADMDLSLTLHQIAQLYRAQGKFGRALDAYEVALRGMKKALGKHHPNVAAVLGNIGNLQKEMGDLDGAYKTYQEVLGIESYRLGLSHPDVAITLHNIATIDAARGNHDHALQLYRKVIGLQKKLFGEDNLSVAVTAACMGDVYEKIGELENSIDSFDEAVRIKSAVLGRHSIDVGRLLHKLGKLSFLRKEYIDAESYTARAILIYRLNKLGEDHEWFIDAKRDTADIDAAIAMGSPDSCEI
jgi:tetratricopeptide (TPR) repeat protein